MIGRRFVAILTASPENPRRYEPAAPVALIDVTALADLPAAASLPSGSGPVGLPGGGDGRFRPLPNVR